MAVKNLSGKLTELEAMVGPDCRSLGLFVVGGIELFPRATHPAAGLYRPCGPDQRWKALRGSQPQQLALYGCEDPITGRLHPEVSPSMDRPLFTLRQFVEHVASRPRSELRRILRRADGIFKDVIRGVEATNHFASR